MNSRTDREPPVIVVGAGIGGLAAAIELAANGHRVLVLEKAPEVGGKMRRVLVAAAAIDAGPTVLTMRWVFDRLFERAGARLDDHVRLQRASLLGRHAWEDGAMLDLHADPGATADAIGRFAGADDARGYLRFREYARKIFECVEQPMLLAQRPSLPTLLGRVGIAGGLRTLLTIDSRRSMWQALGDFFRDPRLRQLFARYATYSGCSPFLAPATLNLISHVEAEGVHYVEGGMQELALAMRRLLERLGGEVRTGEGVREVTVRGGRASGVVTERGEPIEALAVVVNADVAALAGGQLGASASRAVTAGHVGERSLSAVTWAVHASTSGMPLVRHNVFFSSDYQAEFRDLFDRRRVPTEPTVYVCAQDRGDGKEQVEGPERLLVLVNAPADGDHNPMTSKEIEECAGRTFSVLQRCGLTVHRTEERSVATTPTEFSRLFPATGGALYGPVSHGWKAAFERAPAQSRIPGLFLAGGSAHPGAGVPMVALSGSLAAERVLASLAEGRASTWSWSRAATRGGTSTR